MKALENLTDMLVEDILSTPDSEILIEAELDKAREIIAGFLLWRDPAYKPSPSESLEKLLRDARAWLEHGDNAFPNSKRALISNVSKAAKEFRAALSDWYMSEKYDFDRSAKFALIASKLEAALMRAGHCVYCDGDGHMMVNRGNGDIRDEPCWVCRGNEGLA